MSFLALNKDNCSYLRLQGENTNYVIVVLMCTNCHVITFGNLLQWTYKQKALIYVFLYPIFKTQMGMMITIYIITLINPLICFEFSM